MESRFLRASGAQKTQVMAKDLGPEHLGKFISLVWAWEWENFDETIEGILVSSNQTDTYHHVIEVATEKDRADFLTGRGVWSEEVEVWDEMPEEWKPLSRKLKKLEQKKLNKTKPEA